MSKENYFKTTTQELIKDFMLWDLKIEKIDNDYKCSFFYGGKINQKVRKELHKYLKEQLIDAMVQDYENNRKSFKE